MISEWDAVSVFLYLWAKQCWNCMGACFALESTALGKCCIRAGASAWYLHVFVMSDNLAHAYAAQKTSAVGMSRSSFTSEKWQALLHHTYRWSVFFYLYKLWWPWGHFQSLLSPSSLPWTLTLARGTKNTFQPHLGPSASVVGHRHTL